MATQLVEPQPEGSSKDHRLTLEDVEVEVPARRKTLRAILKERRRALLLAGALALLAIGAASWYYLSSYEATDDAQVDGHLHPVSARINGTIIRVNPDVEDSHYVQAGTVLAEIDPADFQAERDRAQAEYDRLKASSSTAADDVTVTSSGSRGRLDLATASVTEAGESVASERASLEAAHARLAHVDANFNRAEADRARYERLLAKHEISPSEDERVATEAATDREAVTTARAEITTARNPIPQPPTRPLQRTPTSLPAAPSTTQLP